MHRIKHVRGRAGRRLSLMSVAAVMFTGGMLVGNGGIPFAGADSSLENEEAYATFVEAWELIQEEYVDPESIDDDALIYGATQGMVEAVGDTGHTTFLNPDQVASMDADLDGDYVGVGIAFDFNGPYPRVTEAYAGSPAFDAGIQPNDLVVEIDGVDVYAMTNEEFSDLIRGDAGDDVDLKIDREEEERFTVTLTRAEIALDPVAWWMIEGNIAHVQLNEFTTGSAIQVSEAIDNAVASGATAFILDLRNNGGGLIDELQDVAALFLPSGSPIFQQEDRSGNRSTVSVEDGTEFDYPLVVLINRGTASSAEITAAAISEAGIGVTLGETTFGTGTGLYSHSFEDGSVLFLGIVLWLTPGGEQIWKVGLEPDIPVILEDPVDRVRPTEGETFGRDELKESGDTQLQRAVQTITSRTGER